MTGTDFGFSHELDAILKSQIDEIQKKFAPPWIAAFDADGTLWNCDIGEAFFQHQIDYCQLPNMPADPWKHYEDLKKVDHVQAYLWLAQINLGQYFSQVQKWAAEAVARNTPIPIFKPQKNLIAYLHQKGFQVYIVTASIQWAVAPAAPLVGVACERVLGIQTAVVNGVVTNDAFGPITWREGKATGLKAATGGRAPHFCAGNTTGDTALLESSLYTRLAVCSAQNTGELAETEKALQRHAREQNWLTHQF